MCGHRLDHGFVRAALLRRGLDQDPKLPSRSLQNSILFCVRFDLEGVFHGISMRETLINVCVPRYRFSTFSVTSQTTGITEPLSGVSETRFWKSS